MSLRDQLLETPLPVAPVPAPEYGDGITVYVRTFPGSDVDKIDKLGTGPEFLIRLAILAMCDADGVCLFSDEDADAVGRLPISLLRRVSDKALSHNGLDAESEKN
jgi:hypothetical protein